MSIEGIPEGWELVRIGRPAIGEFIVSHKGEPKEVFDEEYCGLDCVIIRKIEKTKQYRAFAYAAEFLAHPLSGDWIDVGAGQFAKVQDCSDNGIWFSGDEDIQLYEDAIADLRFRDGTPFGVEVAG